MPITEYDTFTIASHFVSALENGDYTGLSDDDENELEAFLDTLPRNHKIWIWGESEEYARDAVTGLYASCINATLHIHSIGD
jgi:hypothetical protein